MDWQDSGYVLSARPHGETSAIIDVFTGTRGRHMGLVRGGRSRRLRPVLQPGNKIRVVWKARLEDHLGMYTVELERSHAELVFGEPAALEALMASTRLLSLTLPERERHAKLFDAFGILIEALPDPAVWPAVLARFELGLLQELGFGLDLASCAVTGRNDHLTHVSPKTGRAVSRSEAEPYLDRLLPLPAFLTEPAQLAVTPEEARTGFALTGYFLEHWLLHPQDKRLPDARARMLNRLERGTG